MLFAVDENGCITDIDEAVSENSYFCPACHEELSLKTKGAKRRPHFAHKPKSACTHGYETALHLMAKKIIEEADSFYLPEISFTRGYFKRDIVVEGQTVNFSRVELEKRLEGIIPDLIGYVSINGTEVPIAIEIFVTHEVGQEKLQKLKAQRLRTIEIDLSDFKENDLQKELLTKLISGNSIRKRWIYNPKEENKLEEYKRTCEEKKVYKVWSGKGSYYYDVVRDCPRNKFEHEGDIHSNCYLCPHMIKVSFSTEWTILCELPEH